MARIRLEEGPFGTYSVVATRQYAREEWKDIVENECNRLDAPGLDVINSHAARVRWLEAHNSLPDRRASALFQVDYDYPPLARTFGWDLGPTKNDPEWDERGCTHDSTDGTITCPDCGKSVGAFIGEAIEYLNQNIGKVVEDPGYLEDS